MEGLGRVLKEVGLSKIVGQMLFFVQLAWFQPHSSLTYNSSMRSCQVANQCNPSMQGKDFERWGLSMTTLVSCSIKRKFAMSDHATMPNLSKSGAKGVLPARPVMEIVFVPLVLNPESRTRKDLATSRSQLYPVRGKRTDCPGPPLTLILAPRTFWPVKSAR